MNKFTDIITQLKSLLHKGIAAMPINKNKSDSNSEKTTKSQLTEVNVFPLKDVVLFPGGLLPLQIFEDRYKLMTDDSLSKKIPMAMGASGLVQPGLVCGGGEVRLIEEMPDHRKKILVTGQERFIIREILQKEPFYKVLAEVMPPSQFNNPHDEQLEFEKLKTSVRRWIFSNPAIDDAYIDYVDVFQKPIQLADFIAGHFLPTAAEKQKLIEENDPLKHIQVVQEFLERESQKFASVVGSIQRVFAGDSKIRNALRYLNSAARNSGDIESRFGR